MKNLFLTIFVLCFTTSSFALSEGTFQVIIKKQEEKINSRWSLSDYMRTQKQMSLMDQWLALHTSPDYPEFAVWGSRNKLTDVTKTKTKIGNEYGFLFYYKIFGLEGKLEEVSPLMHDKNLFLGLRIFGRADQGSNLKLLYGIEQVEDYTLNDKATPQLGGISATFYLLPFIGIDGGYRRYLKSNFKLSSTELTGELVEYGAFIEIYFLRFYMNQQKKNFYYHSTTSDSKKTFKTNSYGVRIYF